jgi:hypothetical protein
MRFYIKDLSTGKEMNVTDLVIDTLEQGELPAWDDLLTLQGIDLAAEIARNQFEHNNIDAYTK